VSKKPEPRWWRYAALLQVANAAVYSAIDRPTMAAVSIVLVALFTIIDEWVPRD
jgi:hypothetical protein